MPANSLPINILFIRSESYGYTAFILWRTQRDSNLQSLPSEGNALSSYAMGAIP